jgi:hypothetical protein
MTYLPDRDYLIEVQQGNVAGASLVHAVGRNDAVPDAGWEFVNFLGFTAWPLSAATTVRIKAGGDAADTAAGAGAQEVTVQGIDSNFAETSEAIATAGAGASAVTTASFWRVHRAWVSAVGTYGAANTAAVTIENGGGGTDLIRIGIEEGQAQSGGWTVPVGKTGYLLSLHLHVDAKQSANVRVFTREDIDDTSAPMKSKRIKLFFEGVVGTMNYVPRSPVVVISEKSDIWVEAYGDGGIIQISADMEILVIDD